jgi:hypothetical protein
MSAFASVQIIGAPTACRKGRQDTWRRISGLIATRLRGRFGHQVRVAYLDLSHPACPPLPVGAQLPLILVDGQLLSSGGKLSGPAIRKRLEELGLRPEETRQQSRS